MTHLSKLRLLSKKSLSGTQEFSNIAFNKRIDHKNTSIMKFSRILLAISIAACISSCMKGGYETSFTGVGNFEYSDTSKYFVNGIYDKQDLIMASASLSFNGKRNDDGEFFGGVMAGIRRDSVYLEGYVPKSLYTVCDPYGGAGKSSGFGILFDSKGAMPEHEVSFLYSNIGTCTLSALAVANTTYIVNTIMFGLNGIPAFESGDYLTLKVTAIRDGQKASSASIDLAKHNGKSLEIITKWTAMDVTAIGSFEYLDLDLESNRTDLPLYCCIDNLVANVTIKQ